MAEMLSSRREVLTSQLTWIKEKQHAIEEARSETNRISEKLSENAVPAPPGG